MSTYTAANDAMLKNYHEEVGESLALGLKTYYPTPGFPAKAMGDLRAQNIIARKVAKVRRGEHRELRLPEWVEDYLPIYEDEYGPISV